MSRSNPSDAIRNPATRWFEWSAGANDGFIRWYDRDAKRQVQTDLPFTFLLLDELSTVKGWHDASESGIYANEVRDTRQEVLVVRAFKGGDIATGIYSAIKDRVSASGGHYCASLYIAYKDAGELRIGNLMLKGASAGAWMEFKRQCPSKKDANGKSLRGYYVDAVTISASEQRKKGGTTFRVPVFSLSSVSAETQALAVALDEELQSYLNEYLKRPRAEAATPNVVPSHDEPPPDDNPPPFDDDIPF